MASRKKVKPSVKRLKIKEMPVEAPRETAGELVALKSHNNKFAVELARSKTHATLLHFQDGPFVIENCMLTRDHEAMWKPCPDMTAKQLCTKWLYHPLGIALHGTDEALAAIAALAHDQDWKSKKAEKVEKQNIRAEKPSSRAREILRGFDLADKKTAKPFYDACEAAGIDRKLAASVLCIERKKLK